ncbi:hypothetical protein sscle_07g058950 [Sclerotinia sclerotiorum 1980 UF-70]|uniref:YMC020W-like alpha/beta hydrolase domain-containing protein n=1 Tax=Sclerotinia sclerotiorum (strain ATCC 18683 / 1980 / Ss-1) TaxID=665079 RepID=A0A1D9Q881_SCLS1|nr:hypothetical protein sscle_07g058950 [Sclerotinia sclerotiorum 1980 UF-70]
MPPSRKRSKLDSSKEQSTNSSKDTTDQGVTPPNHVQHAAAVKKQLGSRASWYGTWLRKSTVSTQVVRETISADKTSNGNMATEINHYDQRKPSSVASRPPSMYLGKSKPASEITLGVPPEEAPNNEINTKKDENVPQDILNQETPKTRSLTESDASKETKPKSSPIDETAQQPISSQGWLGWLGMPLQMSKESFPVVEEPQKQNTKKAFSNEITLPEQTIANETIETPKQNLLASRSWFNLWPAPQAPVPVEGPREPPSTQVIEGNPVVMEDASKDVSKPAPPTPSRSTAQPGGSSWASAFWYSDTTKKATDPPESQETGELAVSGEQSQNQPLAVETVPAADVKAAQGDKKSKPGKKGRPKSVEIEEIVQKTASAQSDDASKKVTTSPQSPSPPNLILPSVQSTYHLMENASILRQLTRLIVRGRQKPVKHVALAKEVPKIKNAVAIGVHGLFPAPLLRKLIGQPSGTSIRFANHAAAAIRRWTDANGSPGCEIEKVALDGEGKIFERVDKLWELLSNWTDRLRQADFIMVAAHSQGVPVALMLVAKLIEEGIVSSARIGVCAMAGVSLGPFASHQTGYQAALFNDMITELFEFANYESDVAKHYEEALRRVLKYGVRITFCASIDDQLVSIESAVFSPAEHPYIYRAVFVDGRIHAPDFIAHLVGFALKLRNLGVSDHGLIRELSAPLAGSLYTGGGHSRLYDDDKVYDMAMDHALATTSVPDVPLHISQYSPPTNANPYVLPWIMRGVLEEEFVKTELHSEAVELLKQFDDWKPSTKVLQDVKYRLEAVRSKL